jgi:glycosyltransferase involved in cell wall biosynthesis
MIKLGVDAFNLDADRRGMGRLVRQTLERLARFADVHVVRVYRTRQNGALTPKNMRAAQLDAVWYPWNGMRFEPHAPAIVTINDPFAFTYPHPNPVARWREQAPIRRALRRADCIFTLSQWGANELQRLFGVSAQRMRVVLPAVDPFWTPVPAASPTPYVLFVAGPDARKNARLLFQAYDAAFAEDGPQLVVVGTLAETDEAYFAAMRAPKRRAAPSDEELRALYSGALAVAVPSVAEGFGLPVVEAMACGAPVLASNASALPEAAGGAAVLLPAGDVPAWKDALLRIARDERLRSDLRERGFARVKSMDPDAPATALIESVRRLREGVR